MPNGISIRHIRNLEEFEALREQWNQLLAERQRKTAFLTWEWLSAWWKIHQNKGELWLVTAWINDQLVGAAPLMKTSLWKHGLQFRLLHSLGAPNCDESDFPVRNGDLQIVQALCNYLYSQRAQWDAIELNEFESKSSIWGFVQDYFINTGCVIQASTNYHYHIPIHSSWEGYWKKLSKNLRHNIERRLRRAQENHRVEFKYVNGNSLAWDDFETLFEVSEKGNFPEKYKSAQERSFHRELLDRMHNRKWIEIAFLCLDGKAIAFEYGFNLDGRFEDWRTGFDLNHSELAGGTLLLYHLLKQLYGDGHHDLDFLRGEYDFKGKWLPERREFVELRIVQPHRLSARLALIWIPTLWHWLKEKTKSKKK
jgi:CelD/BcsL family acetyltransferase involved in cellulose biosynthesis